MGVLGAKLGAQAGRMAESGIRSLWNKTKERLVPTIEGVANRFRGAGAKIGESAGALLPFKTGGRVKKNGKIYAHKGEFILPKGVKPTTHQVKVVRKNRRKKQGGHRVVLVKRKK